MELKDFADVMENGAVYFVNRKDLTGEISWNEHPQFKGVFLKNIILGKDTEGQVSCHMVKIQPNCILEAHAHEKQLELHEVIHGEGTFILDSKELSYFSGAIGVIPKGTNHKVCAGKNGLILLAKFFPALL